MRRHYGVIAYHVIFGTYGFWLPNDPRGSWSNFVGSWDLFRHGPATKTDTRRSVAHVPHSVMAQTAAKETLRYPPVALTGHQALAVARGLGRMILKAAYAVYACAILPDHVHMVIGRYHYPVERIVTLLKGEASRELAAAGLHPLRAYSATDGTLPSPWAKSCWRVFLDSHADVTRAIEYVEQNPIKEGKRAQRWPFVVAYSPHV